MPHITSLYPPVPPAPETNVINLLLNRPEQVQRQGLWEKDYTIMFNANTGQKRSFHEHRERVFDAATALGSPTSLGGLGLETGKNEMVGVLSDNCMDYFTLCHALLALGVPYALLSSYATPFELSHSIELAKVTHLFVAPRLLGLALGATKKAGISEKNVYTLEGPKKGRLSLQDMISQVRRNKIPRLGVKAVKNDTLAYLVFSSGTSGLPKAVMISHGNLNYMLLQTVVLGVESAKIWVPPPPQTSEGVHSTLAFLPLHHTMGHGSFVYRLFLAPSSIVILPKWDIGVALKAISKYRIGYVLLIPSVAHQMNEYLKTNKVDLSSVILIGSGAAYLPPKLANALKSHGKPDVRVAEGYGLSECTVAALVQPLPGLLDGLCSDPPVSTGILLPGMEAKIIREDGSLADINEPGELLLKGGNIAMGYFKNEKSTRDTFRDEWLYTGDRFRVDERGFFFFEDRAKDTLKVSGMQVSPVEIEGVLLDQPDKYIIDVSVAGVSGGRTSDERVPRAWVVLSDKGKRQGKAVVVKALNAWVTNNLSKYKHLRGGIGIVDEIPKSPTGKVLRRVLTEQYEKQVARRKNVQAKL